MYTAGVNEGHTMNVCDLEFQGQPSRSRDCFLTFLISSTSKMLESTPRSTFYHVYNRRYERSCKKVFDLDFQDHAIKIEFFHYHRWIPWPRKHTHKEYFWKIRTGRPKSRGVVLPPPPLGRPKVDFYLGHLRVKFAVYRSLITKFWL